MQLQANALRGGGLSVQGAAYLYEKLTPFRTPIIIDGRDTEARSVSVHKKRYVNLRPITNGWAYRYHDTDVVTWTIDPKTKREFVTIEPWSSVSTETFARAYSPGNVEYKMACVHGRFALIRDHKGTRRVYNIGDHIVLTRDEHGVFMPHNHEITATFVDASPSLASIALRKTKYHAFAQWLDAVMRLEQKVDVSTAETQAADAAFRWQSSLALLDDPNSWPVLRATSYLRSIKEPHSINARLESIKHTLRDRIYEHHKAFTSREVSWYDASQFENQRRLQDKYPWA